MARMHFVHVRERSSPFWRFGLILSEKQISWQYEFYKRQWRSQNAEKITHIKSRLLDQALIQFNYVPFHNGNFSYMKRILSIKSSLLEMFLALLPTVYIFLSLFVLLECVLKLLKQGYRYHKIRKAFSKFYHRHSELIVKYNIGLKTLLQQGISEPIFYVDLVYKFKRIVGKTNFSDQFKKIVKRYIRVGYNLDIMRQSPCLVLNPITVYSYGFLFNYTTVGQASDSMTALT